MFNFGSFYSLVVQNKSCSGEIPSSTLLTYLLPSTPYRRTEGCMTLNNWWTDIDTYNSNHGTKSHEYILNGMCMAEVIKFKGQRELDSNPRSSLTCIINFSFLIQNHRSCYLPCRIIVLNFTRASKHTVQHKVGPP